MVQQRRTGSKLDSTLGWREGLPFDELARRGLCQIIDGWPWLRLEIRCAFFAVNPRRGIHKIPDGEGNYAYVRDWRPGEVNEWNDRWRAVILDGWQHRFRLVPRLADPSGVDTNFFRPIACMLRITIVSAEGNPHLRTRVYASQERDAGEFRSSCYRGGAEHRLSFDSTLMSTDVEERVTDEVEGTRQTAALHEFGHYLGLPHVAAGTNHLYGARGSWEASNLMGRGWRWHPRHGQPWLDELRLHTRDAGYPLQHALSDGPRDWQTSLFLGER